MACSCSNPHAKGILRIENQFGLCVYKGGAFDTGMHFALSDRNAAFEHTPDDTLLFPNLALANFSIGVEAGQLGAGAGAAWRTIIGLAGTEHEILTVDRGQTRRTKEFDVVDFLISGSGDSLSA